MNADGNRFCDELGHRDYVSGEMFKNKFPIRLILNSKASKVLDFHTRHYSGRGLMKKMTGRELAKDIGCGVQHLKKVFDDYNFIAKGEKSDPYGKKFFHNLPFSVDDDYHVALMEPVLHFTMGGIEIDDRARVLNSEGKPFHGLFACGEVAGGVHGANRLGGSSLLGCVVYGRVAGDSASQYLFQKVLKDENSTSSVARDRLSQISLHIDPNNPGRVTIDWTGALGASRLTNHDDLKSSPSRIPGQAATHALMKPGDGSLDPSKATKGHVKVFSVPKKEFTFEEVAQHNKKGDVWVVVKGVVMDVGNFLEDHPGGVQAIMNFAGRDATEEFAMLHDDEVIPKYAPSSVIGHIAGVEPKLDL